MSYEVAFGDGPFEVIVTASDSTGWEELGTIDARIAADPRFRPGMNVLYDYGALEPDGAASTEDMRAAAARDGSQGLRDRFGLVAIVASSDAVFGVGRMWLAFLDQRAAARTTLVRSRAEAYRWLATATAAQSQLPS